MATNNHYFYVLYCQDNTLYAGYTNNLKKRLNAHNSGTGAKYTRVKRRQPVQLIYSEVWSTKSLAMQAEYRFKQLNRHQKEAYLKEHSQTEIQNDQPIVYYADRKFIEKEFTIDD